MNTDALFSSARADWETPQALFDVLDAEFRFTVDAAATAANTKVRRECMSMYAHRHGCPPMCKGYFTPEDDALTQPWWGTVFCNPPYGRAVADFIRHGACEAAACRSTVVFLVPARTDTAWWHEYVMHATEVRLLPGRLRFGGAAHGAPFPSAVVVFDERYHANAFVRAWDWKRGML